MDIKEGDVILFSWNTVYGKIIKLHNYIVNGVNRRSNWTHVGIVGQVIDKDTFEVFEALSDGFVSNIYTREQLFTLKVDNKIKIGRPLLPLNNVYDNCDKLRGRPYSMLDILHTTLYLLFGTKSFIVDNNAKQLICSEAVARILFNSSNGLIDMSTEYDKDMDIITPLDVRLSKNIHFFD